MLFNRNFWGLGQKIPAILKAQNSRNVWVVAPHKKSSVHALKSKCCLLTLLLVFQNVLFLLVFFFWKITKYVSSLCEKFNKVHVRKNYIVLTKYTRS